MQPQMIVRFLHNLFTALWIGGMLTLVSSVIPAVRKNKKLGEPWPIINSIQSRIRPIAIVSIVGLAITGVLLGRSTPEFSKLMGFGTPYMNAVTIKHIVTIFMIALAIFRLCVNKRLKVEQTQNLQKLSLGILIVNAFLGVVVLFLSSMI